MNSQVQETPRRQQSECNIVIDVSDSNVIDAESDLESCTSSEDGDMSEVNVDQEDSPEAIDLTGDDDDDYNDNGEGEEYQGYDDDDVPNSLNVYPPTSVNGDTWTALARSQQLQLLHDLEEEEANIRESLQNIAETQQLLATYQVWREGWDNDLTDIDRMPSSKWFTDMTKEWERKARLLNRLSFH